MSSNAGGPARTLQDKRILREVKTFARISNHANVVRYYAAWTEPVRGAYDDADDGTDADVESQHPHESSVTHSDHHDSDAHDFDLPLAELKSPLASVDTEVYFESDAGDNGTSAGEQLQRSPTTTATTSDSAVVIDELSTVASNHDSKRNRRRQRRLERRSNAKRHSISVTPGAEFFTGTSSRRGIGARSASAMSLPNGGSNKPSPTKMSRKRPSATAILYIQMQLCPFSDLRRWIRERGDCVDVVAALRIFRQIVDGLNHIHEMGFAHNDVKPEVG